MGRDGRPAPSDEFAALCRERADAGDHGRWSVARNGTIIEQAQILTTHNLATLAGPVGLGATMARDWPELARRAFGHVVDLVRRVERNPRPLGTIKDAAYAWRQMVFYLSLADSSEREAFSAHMADALGDVPHHVETRLRQAVDGLGHVMTGGSLDPRDSSNGRRFQGWVVDGHWMLHDQNAGVGRPAV